MEGSLEGEIRKKVVETLRTAEDPLSVTELRGQVLDKLGFPTSLEEKVRDVVFKMIRGGQLRISDGHKVMRG